MLKKFAVAAKWSALVSGGGCWFGGSVAVAAEEDGGLWPPRGEGESEAADAEDLPRPRERPRRRYTRFLRGEKDVCRIRHLE